MGNTATVTDDTFETEVLKSDLPVVVDFWAEWCLPCHKISPMLEQLADEHSGKVKVAKLNADQNPQTVRQYGVMALPTLIFFKDGEKVNTMVGAKPKSALQREVEAIL